MAKTILYQSDPVKPVESSRFLYFSFTFLKSGIDEFMDEYTRKVVDSFLF